MADIETTDKPRRPSIIPYGTGYAMLIHENGTGSVILDRSQNACGERVSSVVIGNLMLTQLEAALVGELLLKFAKTGDLNHG